jgi:hypothetical protein
VSFIFYTCEVSRVLLHTAACIYLSRTGFSSSGSFSAAFLFLQMDLSERFNVVTSSTIVRKSELKLDAPYPIVSAQTVKMKYGPTVILTLQDSIAVLIKVFLPRRYGMMFLQEDMTAINEKSVTRAFKYLGTCPNTKSFILTLCKVLVYMCLRVM